MVDMSRRLHRLPATRPLIALAAALTLAIGATAAEASQPAPAPVCGATTCTVTFPAMGDAYTWTVPANLIGPLTLDVQGAAGGDVDTATTGGNGARVTGQYTATAGQVLTVSPGGSGTQGAGGWNGGGAGTAGEFNYGSGGVASIWLQRYGQGGGGASDIRVGGTDLGNRIIVAAGGGGASRHAGERSKSTCSNCDYGTYSANGGAGGQNGANGTGNSTNVAGTLFAYGKGATASAGGSGGYWHPWGGNGYSGAAGTSGLGGNANGVGGGGGGGGWFGGGGGTWANCTCRAAGGGGGGSSYAAPGIAGAAFTTGYRNGDGQIVITYAYGAAPMLVASTPTMFAVPGAAYSYTFTATGAPAPTFTVASGTLPAGLALSSAGVLSGTPTTEGTSTFTVTASNSQGSATSAPVSITVSSKPVFTAFAAPDAIVDMPYRYTFVTGGATAATISATAGTLPPGLALAAGTTPGTAVLSGTPTTAGTFTSTLTATSSTGSTAQQVTIQVMAAAPMLGTAQLTVGAGRSGTTGLPMTAGVQVMAPRGSMLASATSTVYADLAAVGDSQQGLSVRAGGLILIGRATSSGGDAGAASFSQMIRLNSRGNRLAHRYYNLPIVIVTVSTNAAGQTMTTRTTSTLVLNRQTIAPAGGTFDTLATSLNAAGDQYVATVAQLVTGKVKSITCIGYADERGTRALNFSLGAGRAASLCAALRAAGVRAGAWKTISRGPDLPRAKGMTAAAWAKNRRAEILILR
jgi:outer membrane protein OmpA-like peptidoglycan-associated protein